MHDCQLRPVQVSTEFGVFGLGIESMGGDLPTEERWVVECKTCGGVVSDPMDRDATEDTLAWHRQLPDDARYRVLDIEAGPEPEPVFTEPNADLLMEQESSY